MRDRCKGTGSVRSDYGYGTPHYSPCPDCCKHDQGFWPLTEHYMGYAEGDRWCCLAGCGFALSFKPYDLCIKEEMTQETCRYNPILGCDCGYHKSEKDNVI